MSASFSRRRHRGLHELAVALRAAGFEVRERRGNDFRLKQIDLPGVTVVATGLGWALYRHHRPAEFYPRHVDIQKILLGEVAEQARHLGEVLS